MGLVANTVRGGQLDVVHRLTRSLSDPHLATDYRLIQTILIQLELITSSLQLLKGSLEPVNINRVSC